MLSIYWQAVKRKTIRVKGVCRGEEGGGMEGEKERLNGWKMSGGLFLIAISAEAFWG